MYYCAADAIAETIANCPTPHAFTLLVEKLTDNDCTQTLKTWCDSNGYNATVFVRSGYPNWGNGWRQLATATPPQVFDLPLSDGWTEHRASEYFKTQENIVTVYFQVHTSSPQGGEITLATLPEGFRPQATIGGAGYFKPEGGKYTPSDMKIYSDGRITGYNDVGAAEYYTGFFTFVAAP